MSFTSPKNIIALAFVGVAIIAGALLLEREPAKLVLPEDMKGIIIDSPPEILPDFILTKQDGSEFRKQDLYGKWTLMFFGYTHCPDVCPTSLRVMDGVSHMQGLPENTQFVFTSVDPGRDTPEVLKEFVSYFNPKFIGISGDKAELQKLTGPLGVVYDYEGDVASGDYIVNHFAAVYILDPKGRERAFILPPHNDDRVGDAFKLISDYYQ